MIRTFAEYTTVLVHLPETRCDVASGSGLTRPTHQVTPSEEDQFRRFWAAHAEQPLVGRNRVLASICPQLHGLFLVKLATALMLIGGVAQRDPHTGARCRAELHMLLVGDPGTGASALRLLRSMRTSRAS